MATGSTGISPRGGAFTTKGNTATANTAYTIGIPPYPGARGQGTFLYGLNNGVPNWLNPGYFTKVDFLPVLSGSTAHTLYLLRPLNWSVVAVAGAKNTTAFTLADNPGKYSTNFHYPIGPAASITPGATGPIYTTVASTADLTPTTTHYFAVQLADGTWFFDLLAAFSTSTFVVGTTTTIPNVTGGGIPKGAIFFLLGSSATIDPNNGAATPPNLYPTVSVTTNYADNSGDGICTSIHPGDPMMLYNANATAQSFNGGISGSYVLY